MPLRHKGAKKHKEILCQQDPVGETLCLSVLGAIFYHDFLTFDLHYQESYFKTILFCKLKFKLKRYLILIQQLSMLPNECLRQLLDQVM